MKKETYSATFGAIIIGDEILSGKRQDKHLTKMIELLHQRGCVLSWAEYVGDDPKRLTDVLRRAFASSDVVFSFGGIGATPDDHTRQCAAAALNQKLALHPEAEALIIGRSKEMALERGEVFEPQRPDNIQRLQMGCFPSEAKILPNSYNRIPGFSCQGIGGGWIHFMPGFPVMAWPMIEWALDNHHRSAQNLHKYEERSVIVIEGQESALTPLMLEIEAKHEGITVFSLPSVEGSEHYAGLHIELGVKGEADLVNAAWEHLIRGLNALGAQMGKILLRQRG